MNMKKYFIPAILLNTVLVAFAFSFSHHVAREKQRNAVEPETAALTGPVGKFGPILEKVVPDASIKSSPCILNLETGRMMQQPPLDYFDSRADAIIAWISSNGLDISCSFCSGSAACITYDMIILPVDRKCWNETTEEDLQKNPALARGNHSPRRLLVVADTKPDTFIFRTGAGTLGMLQLVGISEDGRGVTIRYKLLNPA